MNKKTITFGLLGFTLGALIFLSLGEVSARGFIGEKPENCNLEIGSEEWKEKMEERGMRSGNNFMGMGLRGLNDEVKHEIETIEKGIRITVTSDNPEIVERLQERAK